MLKRQPLGERDDIVVCLGQDSGRFSALVKGSRSPRSKLGGLLEPPVELEASIRQGSSLGSLTQLQLCRAFGPLRHNLDALLTAGFLARLFTESLPEQSPIEELYEVFGELLERLGHGAAAALTALWAQDHLLGALGVQPEIDSCVGCGGLQVEGFSAFDGGLLCAECYTGRGFAVSRSAQQGLLDLRAASLEDDDWPQLDPAVIREIGRIYKLQFQQHLGLPDRVFRPVLPKGVSK